MIKHAQPYDPSEFAGYGQGGLAGYGQGGYDVGLENVGLVPGMDPQVTDKSRMPGLMSPWAIPIGVAAGGLVGLGLLRHLGKRLASNAGRRAVQQVAQPKTFTLPPGTDELIQRYSPKHASLITLLGALAR